MEGIFRTLRDFWDFYVSTFGAVWVLLLWQPSTFLRFFAQSLPRGSQKIQQYKASCDASVLAVICTNMALKRMLPRFGSLRYGYPGDSCGNGELHTAATEKKKAEENGLPLLAPSPLLW